MLPDKRICLVLFCCLFVFNILQPQFQRLVLRMSRFYSDQSSGKVWTKLRQIIKAMDYELRNNDEVNHIQSYYKFGMIGHNIGYKINSHCSLFII